MPRYHGTAVHTSRGGPERLCKRKAVQTISVQHFVTAEALFCVMKPLPTIRLTRQEMERAVLDLGVKFATVRQWRYRGVPTRWQIRLMKHFGRVDRD